MTVACDDDTTATCGEPKMADRVSIDTPYDPPLVGEDAVIHGKYALRDNERVYALYVGGLAATADEPNFERFSITIPFATLQARALSAGTPTSVTFDATAVSSCDSTGTEAMVGQLMIDLRAVTGLSVTSTIEPPKYVPNSKNVAVELDVSAGPDAAGVPLTVSTSQGTLLGTSMLALAGDGVQNASATFFLLPDPAKEGTAEVTVQAANVTKSAQVRILGAPTLNPGSTTIAPGMSTTVFIASSLDPSKVKKSLAGCSAVASINMAVSDNNVPFQNGPLHIPVSVDSVEHPIFTVSAGAGAAGGESASVTCYDTFGQSVTAVYKTP
jgi:hypothetical protein